MRRLIPVLCVALAAGLVAGCGTTSRESGGASSASATSVPDPVTTVRQGMDRSLAGTLTMDASVKAGNQVITLSGEMDPAARVLLVTGDVSEPVEARLIGDTAYIKMDSLDGDKPWMKLDLTKLPPGSSLRQSFDFTSQTGIVGGIVSAEATGQGRYRGIADLGKAAEAASTEAGMRQGIESSAKLAKDPSAIPFEAVVDAEGRLTALSYTIATKTLGDIVTEMTMSGFGEPVRVSPPPADDTEEPDEAMYAFF
ncbi:hypothetical protein ACIBTV_23345 [Micromonospora sp. NPDC049366]|uniref:hypothetical protein n=1 Tax=Micromonospora sp. NPDC049366 TaxID=3364271 RepID=UPI0037AD783B